MRHRMQVAFSVWNYQLVVSPQVFTTRVFQLDASFVPRVVSKERLLVTCKLVVWELLRAQRMTDLCAAAIDFLHLGDYHASKHSLRLHMSFLFGCEKRICITWCCFESIDSSGQWRSRKSERYRVCPRVAWIVKSPTDGGQPPLKGLWLGYLCLLVRWLAF